MTIDLHTVPIYEHQRVITERFCRKHFLELNYIGMVEFLPHLHHGKTLGVLQSKAVDSTQTVVDSGFYVGRFVHGRLIAQMGFVQHLIHQEHCQ